MINDFVDAMKKNSELKARINSWERKLSKVILSWELIPGVPKDEFDAFTHKLIGHLTRGAEKEKVHEILESELIIRYGLSPTDNELEQFTIEVMDWWGREK